VLCMCVCWAMAYIGYLRRKLGSNSIETVRGMGYRLIT
jgi:DNA-binding response OmpR family regulator